jgi:hypothetical protein
VSTDRAGVPQRHVRRRRKSSRKPASPAAAESCAKPSRRRPLISLCLIGQVVVPGHCGRGQVGACSSGIPRNPHGWTPVTRGDAALADWGGGAGPWVLGGLAKLACQRCIPSLRRSPADAGEGVCRCASPADGAPVRFDDRHAGAGPGRVPRRRVADAHRHGVDAAAWPARPGPGDRCLPRHSFFAPAGEGAIEPLDRWVALCHHLARLEAGEAAA